MRSFKRRSRTSRVRMRRSSQYSMLSLRQCEKDAATQLEKSAESNAKLISKVQDWQLV